MSGLTLFCIVIGVVVMANQLFAIEAFIEGSAN